MPFVMPARAYLTELIAAAAASLAELPHRGRPDEETMARICDRLAPYVGDMAAARCDFNAD